MVDVASIERREEMFDDVIEAAITLRFFDGEDISRGGEDAELRGVA
jgi:hypothetical protein